MYNLLNHMTYLEYGKAAISRQPIYISLSSQILIIFCFVLKFTTFFYMTAESHMTNNNIL